jgi:GGDEF domain-containing protein
MATLDRKELDHLERRELHLTVLAAVFVLVQAAGLAVLMYPLVFLRTDGGNKWPLRVAYFGFCVLTVLFACYLLDRQRVVRKLKQNLLEQLDKNVEIRQQASADILHSMPGQETFWDRLTMDHRRAMTMHTTMSLLLVQCKPGPNEKDSKQRETAAGEAARAIAGRLRPTDSVYNLASGIFAIILPETDSLNARRVAVRLQEALQEIRAKYGLSADISVQNYPEHVKSSHELEDIVKSMLPEAKKWEEQAEPTLA